MSFLLSDSIFVIYFLCIMNFLGFGGWGFVFIKLPETFNFWVEAKFEIF